MTHLGLGSSLELEPWLDLLGGGEVGLHSLEVAQASWEGCVWLLPGGVPSALPACPGGVIALPCLG